MTSISSWADERLGVFYLARGADEQSLDKFASFVKSYRHFDAKLPHTMYVIFKGFSSATQLKRAELVFSTIAHRPIYLEDVGFDLGAYASAALRVEESHLCFLGTSSRINAEGWLLKLWRYLRQPDIGLVGATGNYEAAVGGSIGFPNPHLRTTAFMISRGDFLKAYGGRTLADKGAAYSLEHGDNSLMAQCLSNGLKTVIVGRNGRGYDPYFWPTSETFRQGNQDNILICDGQSDHYDRADRHEKSRLYALSWGTAGLLPVLRSTE